MTHNKKYKLDGPYMIPKEACQCDECNSDESITCFTPSDEMCYSGPNLSGTGINTNDSLTLALQRIDQQILLLKERVVALTSLL